MSIRVLAALTAALALTLTVGAARAGAETALQCTTTLSNLSCGTFLVDDPSHPCITKKEGTYCPVEMRWAPWIITEF